MDEKIKHRIVGFVVIFAVIALFAPLLFTTTKPAWRSIQEKTTFRIPKEPKKPEVVVKTPTIEWKKPLKVAHISLDDHPFKEGQAQKTKPNKTTKPRRTMMLVDKEALAREEKALMLAHHDTPIASEPSKKMALVRVIGDESTKLKTKTKPVVKRRRVKKATISKRPGHYRVQMASFSHAGNAKALVKKLKAMGYKAYIEKSTSQHGLPFSKVLVGRGIRKQDARKLVKTFEKAFHFKPIIVKG